MTVISHSTYSLSKCDMTIISHSMYYPSVTWPSFHMVCTHYPSVTWPSFLLVHQPPGRCAWSQRAPSGCDLDGWWQDCPAHFELPLHSSRSAFQNLRTHNLLISFDATSLVWINLCGIGSCTTEPTPAQPSNGPPRGEVHLMVPGALLQRQQMQIWHWPPRQ